MLVRLTRILVPVADLRVLVPRRTGSARRPVPLPPAAAAAGPALLREPPHPQRPPQRLHPLRLPRAAAVPHLAVVDEVEEGLDGSGVVVTDDRFQYTKRSKINDLDRNCWVMQYLKLLWFHRVVQPDHAVVHSGGEELRGDGHDGPVRVEGHL